MAANARVASDLERIADDDDFAYATGELIERWKAEGLGIDPVESILGFMEAHPDVEFGTPGPLVHFVEQQYRKGYEVLLLESFARRPTAHTAWMVHRVMNGAADDPEFDRYASALHAGLQHPKAGDATRDCIRNLLDA